MCVELLRIIFLHKKGGGGGHIIGFKHHSLKGKLYACYQKKRLVSILTHYSSIRKYKQEKIHDFKLIVFKEYPEIVDCTVICVKVFITTYLCER